MYRAQAARMDFRGQCASFERFLRDLELVVEVSGVDSADLARVAQLSARTNQFNACKSPFREADLVRRQEAGARAWKVVASDRFGEYGLVGAMVGEAGPESLEVTDFFLSCRALGKGVERHMVEK